MRSTLRLALFIVASMSSRSWSEALCVKVSSAALHAEPRQSAVVTWTVGRYTPLLKIERKGSWYKVQDMDGETHWVAKDLVTSEIKCLSIRVGTTNIRVGPGKQFPIAERPVADRYTPFKRLENQDEWYQVENAYGAKGWIHETNIWRPTVTQSISF